VTDLSVTVTIQNVPLGLNASTEMSAPLLTGTVNNSLHAAHS